MRQSAAAERLGESLTDPQVCRGVRDGHSWKAKPLVHNVALVLGGGGAAGQAWQIGVIAGLAEAGLDLTGAADLVIGTSSGSTTAAHVRSGIPAAASR